MFPYLKNQPVAFRSNILNLLVHWVSHVAEVGEDDKTRVEGGERVDGCGHQTVGVAVVVKLVERGVGEVDTKADADRVEDLHGCVHPHIRVGKHLHSRTDVVLDARYWIERRKLIRKNFKIGFKTKRTSSRKKESSGEENGENEVRGGGGHPDDLKNWKIVKLKINIKKNPGPTFPEDLTPLNREK